MKATIYVENTQIVIFGNYLKQVGRERTSGNPGRHHREVHNLAGRLLGTLLSTTLNVTEEITKLHN